MPTLQVFKGDSIVCFIQYFF